MFVQQSFYEQAVDIQMSLDSDPVHDQGFVTDPLLTLKQKQLQNNVPSLFSNQLGEGDVSSPEKEGTKKVSGDKLKYKKLKQKLNTLSQQIQDQGLFKDQKDVTSPNKSRLMKLALELEKSIKTQAIDYPLVESLLRQIQKIVEHKREHDILILRAARLMSTLLAIIKRFPSLHKTEALQSMLAMDLSLRLLRIMLSLSYSRQLLLVSNQMIALSSLLISALMKQEKKIAVSCLSLLNLILAGPNRIELHPLLNANIQYILCSSLLKRLKSYLQVCLSEDDPSHSEFILLAFKFYYLIVRISCDKSFQRPIYDSQKLADCLSKAMAFYFQSGIQLLIFSINQLIYQKQEGEQKYQFKEDEIPNFKINILLYIFKTLNIIFHVDVYFGQKFFEQNVHFFDTLLFIFQYVKQNFKESRQTRNLCSQIIIFLGNFTFQNYQNQQFIRNRGLLESLCNHPIQYLMEANLKIILIPTFCCTIHQNPTSFKKAFAQNSVQPILQEIEKEINYRNERKNQQQPCFQNWMNNKNPHCKTLSRKTSVSSINSSYSKASMAESYSTQTSNNFGLFAHQVRLEHKFRPQYWQELALELKKIDD